MDSWASSCGSFGVQCLKSKPWALDGHFCFLITLSFCKLRREFEIQNFWWTLLSFAITCRSQQEWAWTEIFPFQRTHVSSAQRPSNSEMAKERFQSIHRCVNGNLNAIKREIKKRPCQNSQTKWIHSSRDANGYAGVHFLDVFYKFKLFWRSKWKLLQNDNLVSRRIQRAQRVTASELDMITSRLPPCLVVAIFVLPRGPDLIVHFDHFTFRDSTRFRWLYWPGESNWFSPFDALLFGS